MRTERRAYTLFEMMVVLAILLIAGAVVMPSLQSLWGATPIPGEGAVGISRHRRVIALDEHHLVARAGREQRGAEAGHPSTDHHDLPHCPPFARPRWSRDDGTVPAGSFGSQPFNCGDHTGLLALAVLEC